MGKKVEYTNGELTIVWQPEMCQHAGICVDVYKRQHLPCVTGMMPMFRSVKRSAGIRM